MPTFKPCPTCPYATKCKTAGKCLLKSMRKTNVNQKT